jgi:hypothetical protein
MDFDTLRKIGRNHIHRPFFQQRHEPEQNNDYRVVVLGAAAIGKSSLILRFINNTFRDHHIPTVEDIYCQVNHFFFLNKGANNELIGRIDEFIISGVKEVLSITFFIEVFCLNIIYANQAINPPW